MSQGKYVLGKPVCCARLHETCLELLDTARVQMSTININAIPACASSQHTTVEEIDRLLAEAVD